ncbi:TPA: hypothetical protein N0F65_008609 [Lagenidium giganteum]|uniref:Uncharacterized protein n=1 Tax=Lagenidium giganteum TaxID=4803 RepID=A0AAV2Z272_9STRA|nr:TPA: hypothetical protein N0F65_008609 [Lagenidium giganteum]
MQGVAAVDHMQNQRASDPAEAMPTSSRRLLFRVELQNKPPGLDVPTSITIRTDAATLQSMKDVHALIRSHMFDDERPLASDDTTKAIEFDVEVYDKRLERFTALTTLDQLPSSRARLNVLLHRSAWTPSTCLALPSRLFPMDPENNDFQIRGHVVHIGEVGNSGKGTGLTTWDGSVILAKYLEHTRAKDFEDKRVVELGAGTGLVGLSVALLGAREVLLTDLAYTMDNLATNIAETLRHVDPKPNVHAQVLDWFQPPSQGLGKIDWILASDVVWVEELIVPLVDTMHTLVRNSGSSSTRILMSHQYRSTTTDTKLFTELERRGFVKSLIAPEQLHPQFVSDRIDVWEIHLAR